MKPDELRIIVALVVSVAGLVLWPRFIKLSAFFALLCASVLFAWIAGIPFGRAISTMQSGFGNLLQQIGLVIALGSVLGTLLEKTGATEAISETLLSIFGKKRSVLAVSAIGALVGIPVFCDSGFIILSKLIPSLAAKASVGQGSLTLALSSSLYTTHSLVPPTPGPLAAAAAVGLESNLGLVILTGMAVSIPVVLISYLYARRFGPTLASSLQPSHETKSPVTSKLHAFLPLFVPILLIAVGSFGKLDGSPFMKSLALLGIPLVALSIGIMMGFTLINFTRDKDWASWITGSLKEAGVILLIIGAGGAFGSVIRESGVDQLVSNIAYHEKLTGLFFLVFAWSIAAVFKIAQGSTTSSMVITSSVLAPLAPAAGLSTPIEFCLLVTVLGGGAMTVSHANDAYFWVVSQFGGLTTRDTFRWYTPMTLVQGVTALVVSILLYLFL